MYAQMADRSGYFLLENLLNQQSKVLTCSLKTTRTDLAPAFMNTLSKGFSSILLP